MSILLAPVSPTPRHLAARHTSWRRRPCQFIGSAEGLRTGVAHGFGMLTRENTAFSFFLGDKGHQREVVRQPLPLSLVSGTYSVIPLFKKSELICASRERTRHSRAPLCVYLRVSRGSLYCSLGMNILVVFDKTRCMPWER